MIYLLLLSLFLHLCGTLRPLSRPVTQLQEYPAFSSWLSGALTVVDSKLETRISTQQDGLRGQREDRFHGFRQEKALRHGLILPGDTVPYSNPRSQKLPFLVSVIPASPKYIRHGLMHSGSFHLGASHKGFPQLCRSSLLPNRTILGFI